MTFLPHRWFLSTFFIFVCLFAFFCFCLVAFLCFLVFFVLFGACCTFGAFCAYWCFLVILGAFWYVRNLFEVLMTSFILPLATNEYQVSRACSATSPSSIQRVSQNFVGNQIDVSSLKYTFWLIEYLKHGFHTLFICQPIFVPPIWKATWIICREQEPMFIVFLWPIPITCSSNFSNTF